MEDKLSGKVRDAVSKVWTQNQAHAAKQIVCHLDATIFQHDLNAQVDYAIRIGMIAERMKNCGANAFIAEVEDLLKA